MWEAVKKHVREVGVPPEPGGREVAAAVIAARLGLCADGGGVCAALEWRTIRLMLDAALTLEAARHIAAA